MEHKHLLVFVELPNPVQPTRGLLKSLSYMDVTLIGSYEVSNTASIERVRETNVEDARKTLHDMETKFEEHGVRVSSEVVFGRDMRETRERLATGEAYDGIFLPGGENLIGRILVGLRDTRNAEHLANIVDFIDREKIIHITLIHVSPESNDSEELNAGERILEEMNGMLTERGVNPHAIDLDVRTSDDPAFELASAAQSYDLVVLGKTQEGHETAVFGPVSSQIRDRSKTSTLIVR